MSTTRWRTRDNRDNVYGDRTALFTIVVTESLDRLAAPLAPSTFTRSSPPTPHVRRSFVPLRAPTFDGSGPLASVVKVSSTRDSPPPPLEHLHVRRPPLPRLAPAVNISDVLIDDGFSRFLCSHVSAPSSRSHHRRTSERAKKRRWPSVCNPPGNVCCVKRHRQKYVESTRAGRQSVSVFLVFARHVYRPIFL